MNNDTTNKPNVLMAVVAYIIFFIPLLTESKSDKFVKYHVKQSLALLILAIGGNMVLGAIPFFGWLAMLPFNLVIVILFIIGVLNALGGTEKRLPLIGKMGEGFTF